MDRRLHEAGLKGDVLAFLDLVREDGNIVGQTIAGSLNTVLHLAAKFGNLELASEIIQLSPKMVSAENGRMETPLYEACLEGHVDIVKLLLEKDPSVAYKVNLHNESALLVACARGQFDVVKHLLSYPKLLLLEDDRLTTPLHAAVSAGHTDIVKEILAARPDFIWKRDFQGCSPLHLACKKGSLEITRELLTLDSDLSSLQDNDGRTPLHWAAMKGHVSILGEILSTSLESAEMLTKQGENIPHLAVKNNQYGALKYLAETPSITKLVNMPDNDDNTILHLATARKLTTMVKYLVDRSPIDVNAVNGNGLTALDVVESDVSNSSKSEISNSSKSEISNSSATLLICTLQEAGCKSCIQLQHGSAEIQPMAGSKTWKVHGNISNPSAEIQPMVGSKTWKVHENISNDPSSGPKKIMNSWTNYPRKQLRNRREKHELHHQSLQKHELHDQRLRNGRNTIGIIAVLIATVTFGAGINPPGGVQQETGKAIMGRKTPFKVFMVCNNVAFFLSLGTIIILVFAGIIPIARQSMMKLLVGTHNVLWISSLFMATGYIAATWLIIPRGNETRWLLVALVSIGGIIFVGIGMILARYWLRKWEGSKRKLKYSNRNSVGQKEDSFKSDLSDLENSESSDDFHSI